MDSDGTCRTCRWYDAHADDHGDCRVDSPTIVPKIYDEMTRYEVDVQMATREDGHWPRVFILDWCGKYEAYEGNE